MGEHPFTKYAKDATMQRYNDATPVNIMSNKAKQKTMQKKNKISPGEAREEAVRELAALTGESEERVRQLLGSKVRGTAEFSQSGDFHFTPQRETGPRLEQVRRTRGGSSLTRTLRDQPRLKMTLYSSPGSTDPEADLVDEANQLLKPAGKRLAPAGRTLIKQGRIAIRADCKTGTLNLTISIPMLRGTDYSTAIVNEMGQALKAVAMNRDKLRRLETKNETILKTTTND